MKIHELITFVNNHSEINKLIIESCFMCSNAPHFEGSVIELIETQFLFLNVPVENATYDIVSATLQIFYDPANL